MKWKKDKEAGKEEDNRGGGGKEDRRKGGIGKGEGNINAKVEKN